MPSNGAASLRSRARVSAWTVNRRVVGALLLRELLTRYGRNNIGFLWLFVEPMLFVGGIAAIWSWIRTGPSNIPIVAFALTGYSSMLLWRNMPSRCIDALKANLSLLYHRQVTVTDIYIARVLLEIFALSGTFVALGIAFYSLGWIPAPEDALQVLSGWLLTAWFGVGLGWLFGGISERLPVVGTLWGPLSYILMILSGTFFLADALPQEIREVLLWLPMMNAIEYLREGWFGSLFVAHYDLTYLAVCNLALTFVGLSAVRQARTDLTST